LRRSADGSADTWSCLYRGDQIVDAIEIGRVASDVSGLIQVGSCREVQNCVRRGSANRIKDGRCIEQVAEHLTIL
jgi:hypothetical protein